LDVQPEDPDFAISQKQNPCYPLFVYKADFCKTYPMKKLLIVLFSAAIIACNSGPKDGSSGTAGSSESSTDTAVTTTSVDTSALNFIHSAAITNGMEIESGQLAQTKARSSEVKAFAGRMVADHSKAMDQLKAFADRKNVELPMMTDMNKNMVSADNTGTSTKPDDESKYGSQSRPGRDITGNDAAGSASNTGNTPKTSGTTQSTTGDNEMYVSHRNKLNKLGQRTGADFDREYMKMMVEDHAKAIALFEKASGNSDPEIKAFAEQMLPTLKNHEADSKKLLSSLKN
jgi:putative membrane protein